MPTALRFAAAATFDRRLPFLTAAIFGFILFSFHYKFLLCLLETAFADSLRKRTLIGVRPGRIGQA
jgi:hypothetical protein